jgi:hypothetical protein
MPPTAAVAPNRAHKHPDFRYCGSPFTKHEQAGREAIQGNVGYGSEAS